MNKRPLPSKIQDQLCPMGYRAKRHPVLDSAKTLYADPIPTKSRRKISYIPGQKPKNEPTEIPRLFIQGFGGSIKADLRGIGVTLSIAAFAHWIADESLSRLHIHRGDIAIIDPMRPILRRGNLVLAELKGRAVLRRLTSKNRVWYMETAGDSNSESVALVDTPLQGVVVGITRLFTRLKPVLYRGAEANFMTNFERFRSGVAGSKQGHQGDRAPDRPNIRYTKRKSKPFLLAGEEKSPYVLTEADEKPLYPRSAKRR